MKLRQKITAAVVVSVAGVSLVGTAAPASATPPVDRICASSLRLQEVSYGAAISARTWPESVAYWEIYRNEVSWYNRNCNQ